MANTFYDSDDNNNDIPENDSKLRIHAYMLEPSQPADQDGTDTSESGSSEYTYGEKEC